MNTIKPPKLLVIGSNGQVGWELCRSLLGLGKVVALGRDEFDLSETDAIGPTIRRINPDVIINAAAYTAVDRAEQEKALAMAINATAPGALAEAAHDVGALLVHFSTDYVFDGRQSSPYAESQEPNPLGVYGESKLAGERAIQHSRADHLILRTSWVYGGRGQNFLLTMLRLMKEREKLSIVGDQHGTPTWARLIALVTAQVVRQALSERQQGVFHSDLYHLTASGATTWHGFANRIYEVAAQLAPHQSFAVKSIESISTDQYPTDATRPMHSRLLTRKLEQRFHLNLPDWDECLALCLEDLYCA